MQFFFNNYKLDTARRELSRGPEPIATEPQVLDLLIFLVENRDRVVSKKNLLAAVWGGRIVSDSTLTSRINAARKAIGDNGKEQRLIRTIARKGFRFVGEVRVEEASDTDRCPELPPFAADRPSIAVLPFENLSEDRALELIVSGLAEDVVALLARVPGFFVIARASSFAYRPGSTEIRQVGKELGARYVVTGSARSSAERVRIAVQLVEADTGNQLWAGRYDTERGDTLDLQDEIARRIMVELEPALTKVGLQVICRQRTNSADAWSHLRQGIGAIAMHGWNEESVAEGLRQLRQAIAIDPRYALARGLFALISTFGLNLSLVEDGAAAERESREEAEKAVEIDPNASDVLGLCGCALANIGEKVRGYERSGPWNSIQAMHRRTWRSASC